MVKENANRLEIVPEEIMHICSMTQENLMGFFATKILPKYYSRNNIIDGGNFIYVRGEVPIMMVAHLDTVFATPPIPKNNIFYDYRKKVMWSTAGLGADDRAGVYGIIALLKAGYKPYILFPKDEEIGLIGATAAARSLTLPKAIRYIIELDRRGRYDSVFYNNGNLSFESYINKFGFKTSYGSMSDISALCPAWNISGVNLSIGYYNQHTKQEILRIDELRETLKKVERMLNDIPEKRFEYEELYSFYGGKSYYDKTYYKSSSNYKYHNFGSNDVLDEYCNGCLDLFAPSEMILYEGESYCAECLDTLIDMEHYRANAEAKDSFICSFCGLEYSFNDLAIGDKMLDYRPEIDGYYCKECFQQHY